MSIARVFVIEEEVKELRFWLLSAAGRFFLLETNGEGDLSSLAGGRLRLEILISAISSSEKRYQKKSLEKCNCRNNYY